MGTIGLAFAVGAIVGSFANVCIHRLPRRESLLVPGSHCPQCGTPLAWVENIPLVSFALLRGRCRHCRRPIAWRYPLVEALVGALFAATVAAVGPSLEAVRRMVLETLLVVVFFVDLEHYLIPNRLTYPGIALGLAFGFARGWEALLASALTAAGLGTVFLIITLLSRAALGVEGMGLGDAKLAAMIGAFLGWPDGPLAVLLGIFAGGGLGFVLLASRVRGRRDPVPFGPALVVGALAALWWGPSLLHWYLGRVAG